MRAAAAEAEPLAGPVAVGAPLLTEEDLLALWTLVDAHVASVPLGRGGARCSDLDDELALAVGLLPAGGGAVGLPALPGERPQAAWTLGRVVTVIVTPRAVEAHAALGSSPGSRWGWA